MIKLNKLTFKKFHSLPNAEKIGKMVYKPYELTKEDKMIVEERDP